MNNIITSHKVYAAWEYKKEVEDLNEASKNGLQLIKGGCFCSKFQRNPSVRYIYQMDFCPKPDNKVRYIECFEDAGWEYINSTFNGWHYFRRPYEEGMLPEELMIYTDQNSLYEMENRWMNLFRILSIVMLAAGFFYLHLAFSGGMPLQASSVSLILEAIVFFLMSFCLFSAVRSVKQQREGLPGSFIFPLQAVLITMIICFGVGFLLILFT